MDIRILDSHIREFVTTDATPEDIAREVSLRSASVEKVEYLTEDIAYEFEITSNRVDMMGVRGLSKEIAASLTGANIHATYHEEKFKTPETVTHTKHLKIVNDPTLVRRICAVELEVTQKETPEFMKKRLEEANIRPLNILIDITNYVMLEIGHPTHAFDFDQLNTHTMTIRPSKKGEKIMTLDDKEHTLHGGDIMIEDATGRIIDLAGVMGLANSAITDETTRVLFFVDNNDPTHIRKTSMGLGIRTDAAVINEKDVDPELAMTALLRGLELYEKYAQAKVVEEIIDIYPHPVKIKEVSVSFEKINTLIGIDVDGKKAVACLKLLGFDMETTDTGLLVTPPSWRVDDITMDADVVEEIARMIGYHTLPNVLPPYTTAASYHQAKDLFYWERRVRDALKFWGLTEVYTYSMVSKELKEEGKEYYQLSNPLDEQHVFMRQSLTPSLLEVTHLNKGRKDITIFELAKVYPYRKGTLPEERELLGILLHGKFGKFTHMKGVLEQLALDMGIVLNWQTPTQRENILVVPVSIEKEVIGEIHVYPHELVTAEINFELLVGKYAHMKKRYTEASKFPGLEEDITVVIDDAVPTGNIVSDIKRQSDLIKEVSMTSRYNSSRTFHIVYQSDTRNLTTDDITPVREKILSHLKKAFEGEVK